jgi:alanine racemase
VASLQLSPPFEKWDNWVPLNHPNMPSKAQLHVIVEYIAPEEAEQASELALTPVLHHRGGLELAAAAARRLGRRIAVHVEIDTGMRRMGIGAGIGARDRYEGDRSEANGEALRFLREVVASEVLELEGVFTHFASADDLDPAASLAQLSSFRALLDEAREQGLSPPLIHADNSAGLLTGPALAEGLPSATAVRPGLMLYGVNPAPHLDLEGELKPVMTVQAPVVQVLEVPAGGGVGYASTYRPPQSTRIATLRFGYADGFPCTAGGRGEVWLAGARRPVVGRVSMDYIAVEIGDARVEIGDTATVFGASHESGEPEGGAGGARAKHDLTSTPSSVERALRVEEAARHADTIAYELLARVSARVPRVLIG